MAGRGWARVRLALAGALALGCSGKTATENASTEEREDPTRICEAICAREHECDATRDQPACLRTCASRTENYLCTRRDEFLSGIQACARANSCDTALSADVLTWCDEQHPRSYDLTPAGREFCDAFLDATLECFHAMEEAICHREAKAYNDAALLEAQKCFGGPCNELLTCLSSALGNSLVRSRAASCQ